MNKKTLSLAMGCIPILFTQSVQAGGIKVDLQDTPTAVTAIGAAQLEKANIADLADLSIIKPNTSIGVAQFNIRGLGNANGAVDNAAGFASLYRVNGSTPVALVENLPILVGPQGTLRTPVDLGTTANIDKLELVLLVSNQPHKSADWNSFALSAPSFEADVGSTKLTFGGETVPDSGAISFSGEDSYASYFSDNEAYNYGYQESFAGSVNANLRAVQYRSDLKLSDFNADPFAASVYGLDASAGVVDFVDYAATNNFGDWLQSSHAGASGGSDITVSSGDNSFTSEGVGSTIDFDYLRNSLDTGASCTLRFSYDGFYQHANLNGIGRTFDQPWITYSLDADQSDDSQGTYEQGRYFSYLTDSDDNDQWELDGRDTEIDNAWCVSLKPRFDYKGTLEIVKFRNAPDHVPADRVDENIGRHHVGLPNHQW